MIFFTTVGFEYNRLNFIDLNECKEAYIFISSHTKEIKLKIENKIKKILFNTKVIFITVEPDDINSIFIKIIDVMKNFNFEKHNNDILVNPSGGSTAMRIALYKAAKIFKTKIILNAGRRGDETHQIKSQYHVNFNDSIIDFYDRLEVLKIFLNNYEYSKSESLFTEKYPNHIEKKVKQIIYICKIFHNWEKMDFKNSYELLTSSNSQVFQSNLNRKLNVNYGWFLKRILKEQNYINHPLLILEFYNSFKRSFFNNNYFESLLKLYRFLELLSQTLLFHIHKIDTMEDKITLIRGIEILKEKKVDPNISIDSFMFENIEFFKNFSSYRDNSIYVHGFTNIHKKDFAEIIPKIDNFLLPILSKDFQYIFKLNYIPLKQLPNKLDEFLE